MKTKSGIDAKTLQEKRHWKLTKNKNLFLVRTRSTENPNSLFIVVIIIPTY